MADSHKNLRPRRSDAALRRILDRFLDASDPVALTRNDPVALVRVYSDPHDHEVAGLIVAVLAYGRVASIKAKASLALAPLGDHPARAVDEERFDALDGFVHRFQRGDDLVRFLHAVRRLRHRHGSLAAAFAAGIRDSEPDHGEALDRFILALRSEVDGPLSYGLRFLLPRASAAGGAAKRLCLYLRWMVRPAGPMDLGAWQVLAPARIDPAKLIIPLDTHIERIGRYIGLTDRKSGGLVTARDITATLRLLRPEDPLAYDLALCHLGVSGRCPRKRDLVLCGGCPIRSICRLGAEPGGWSQAVRAEQRRAARPKRAEV